MKPLIKYPVTFLILILGAYTQLCAPLLKGNNPYLHFANGSSLHGQALDTRPAGAILIEQEEEKEEKEERTTFEKYSGSFFSLYHTHLQENFVLFAHRNAHGFTHFSCFSFSQSAYLVHRVFRL